MLDIWIKVFGIVLWVVITFWLFSFGSFCSRTNAPVLGFISTLFGIASGSGLVALLLVNQ